MGDNQEVPFIDSKVWVEHFLKQSKNNNQLRVINPKKKSNQRIIVVENSPTSGKETSPIRIKTISPEESAIEQAKSHLKKYGDEEPKPIVSTKRDDSEGLKEMAAPKSGIYKRRAEDATSLLHTTLKKRIVKDIFH